MGILDFFVEKEPRLEQEYALTELEAKWDDYDVFVLQLPVAVGKTAVEVTAASWCNQPATILFPTNILLSQAITKYPFLTALFRKSFYTCDTSGFSCEKTAGYLNKYCQGCKYTAAKTAVKTAPIRAYNYHVYWANKLFTPVLFVDEAHKLVEMLQQTRKIKLWYPRYKFPENLKTIGDVVEWIEGYLQERSNKELKSILKQITKIKGNAVVEYNREMYRGNEELVLTVRDTSAQEAPPYLWPRKHVKKIVLLSATIGPKDIEDLGLSKRRVCYISCESPIPAANRQVIYRPIANMAFKFQKYALPRVVAEIEKIMAEHPDQKGLIHLPYSLAEMTRPLLNNPRIMRHEKHDKSDVLKQFRESSEPVVLIASGMYEGVDLPYDMARWQIISKVPFLSLADAVIKKRADQDPDWYRWEAIKRLLQTVGRTTRAQDDFSTTYVLDTQFKRIWDEDTALPPDKRMFPAFFRSSVTYRNKPL